MKVRYTLQDMVLALIASSQLRQKDATSTTFFHAAQRESVTGGSAARGFTITRLSIATANATDLTTSVALVNSIKAFLNLHYADTAAHNTALSAAIATADATDLTSVNTLANAIKSAHNTHLAAAGVHYNNDATNTISSPNGTDQTTANTLLNELKGDINLHVASAPAGTFIELSNTG